MEELEGRRDSEGDSTPARNKKGERRANKGMHTQKRKASRVKLWLLKLEQRGTCFLHPWSRNTEGQRRPPHRNLATCPQQCQHTVRHEGVVSMQSNPMVSPCISTAVKPVPPEIMHAIRATRILPTWSGRHQQHRDPDKDKTCHQSINHSRRSLPLSPPCDKSHKDITHMVGEASATQGPGQG